MDEREWLTEQFEPILQSVPMELRAKLEPAELYHEMLEHRWFMGEKAEAEISMEEAAQAYVNTVLRGLPDEEIAVSSMESTGPLANPFDPSQGFADGDERTLTGDGAGQGEAAGLARAGRGRRPTAPERREPVQAGPAPCRGARLGVGAGECEDDPRDGLRSRQWPARARARGPGSEARGRPWLPAPGRARCRPSRN